MCNILIYFCNIDIKHVQHTSETSKTLKTYACNICFQRNIYLLLDDWRLIDAELDASQVAPVEKATPVEKEAGVVENAVAGR